MNGGFAVSPYTSSVAYQPRMLSISQQRCCLSFSHNLVIKSSQSLFSSQPNSKGFLGFKFSCNNSGGASGPEENDTKAVLDAFFLGKAVAEAISERVESTIGEFLSTIGRLQAEQQKQVQDFQEDVLEQAKRAKEKAAREAKEAQGLVPRSPIASEFKNQSNGIAQATISTSSISSVQPANTNSGSESTNPVLGVSDED